MSSSPSHVQKSCFLFYITQRERPVRMYRLTLQALLPIITSVPLIILRGEANGISSPSSDGLLRLFLPSPNHHAVPSPHLSPSS
jgi:hypothetical protein